MPRGDEELIAALVHQADFSDRVGCRDGIGNEGDQHRGNGQEGDGTFLPSPPGSFDEASEKL